MTSRRNLIQALSVGAAALAAGDILHAQSSAAFSLPALPYSVDALEPHIDARTMTIHHDKHHAGYVNNLNTAIAATPALAGKSLPELLGNLNAVPENVRTAVRNNGGGHANHSLFWRIMSKKGGGKPKGELLAAIETKFGGFEKFQADFAKAAAGQFGSGWAWLSVDKSKNLVLTSTPNQDNPWMVGQTPILGIDVWEHAYYLRYQNRRADYIAAWWNVVNWDAVTEEYQKAKKS